ncbi:nuclease-related domain-containing protein [Aliiglaciecola lipolytica]|uniref:nuclease-related domain-containing protein n=1 Tax=Aliiglaciecola lipolytica TaxID=477689 RepID=UPI001C09D571|nr:nuclease-related domain-containing protein [Aliiglaciecola lipolytica]MBU2877714.1 NERD domain-containing protein [Aliiglaciecola lipolytica]
MILKDKQIVNAIDPRTVAGQQQEKDVAFYLRRAFKDHKKVHVINDFSFTYNGENAQIDHLVVYPFGFVLIESKSINGEVHVNKEGEWSRTVGNKWTGMASPIKQVELQQKLLKEYLHEHRLEILPKLFGIKAQSFGMRCWHNICAISSNSMIARDSIPKNISEQVVKTEFIADKLKKVMKLRNKIVTTLTLDSRADFNKDELKSICDFLVQKSKPVPKKVEKSETNSNLGGITQKPLIRCKNCDESKDLTPQHGRYGYFVKCNKCDTNTSMKMPCPECKSKNTKVSKLKETYSVNCQDCLSKSPII